MVDISGLSLGKISGLAGNSMHTAQAGAIILLVALFVEPL